MKRFSEEEILALRDMVGGNVALVINQLLADKTALTRDILLDKNLQEMVGRKQNNTERVKFLREVIKSSTGSTMTLEGAVDWLKENDLWIEKK